MQNNDKKYSDGWYSGVLNGLSAAFSKIVRTFKRNGFIYSSLVMILFIASYSLVINPVRIDKIVEQRLSQAYSDEKTREAESIKKRLAADEIIGDIMSRMLEKYPGVKRTLILEAHNTTKSLQHVDFLYYSCTLEMLPPGTNKKVYLSDDLQRQMKMNLIGRNMHNTLKHRDYIVYDSICVNQPEQRLLQKIADAGENNAMIIPFCDENKEPVILLVISGDDIPVKDIIEYVSEFRKEIERCLMCICLRVTHG